MVSVNGLRLLFVYERNSAKRKTFDHALRGFEGLDTNSKVDFTTYSNANLRKAYHRIHPEKFPENFNGCLAEIQNRKTKGVWDLPTASERADTTLSESSAIRRAHLLGAWLFVGGVLGLFVTGFMVYQYHERIRGFSSIANMVLSWLGKLSGAENSAPFQQS